jgi:hypothetical protein
MKKLVTLFLLLPVISVVSFSVFAQTSPHYSLKGYEFGGGGGSNLQSGSYAVNGVLGAMGDSLSSGSYAANVGLPYIQQANTPTAPTFQNTSNWYNRLKIIINTANNPTSTKYAIAISADNFVTTQYVQSDNTVGSSLPSSAWQTYTTWGGASGAMILGLTQNTTYKVKVSAMNGVFTQSPWSPVSTAATAAVSISFDLDTSPTDTSTNPPYTVDFGTLSVGAVSTASNKIWISLDTNADKGAYVYVYDQYGGLYSPVHIISSATLDLAVASNYEGYGLQVASTSQTSNGPFTKLSPYNGSSENVGVITTSLSELLNTSANPITGGRASIYVKAKASNVTPASASYADTLTLVAAATF